MLVILYCRGANIFVYFFAPFAVATSLSAPYIYNTVLAPVFGVPTNPQAAAQADKLLAASLSQIESLWLKGDGTFLHGAAQPSIADLSLVCEIMQLEVNIYGLLLSEGTL